MSSIQQFATEPIRGKTISDTPGVQCDHQFSAEGINKAYQLVGKYLTYHMDNDLFGAWLEDYIPRSSDRHLIIKACEAWCQEHEI
jgi:hypothetical protein